MLKYICILDGDYMIYQLGNETYNVEIIKKGNKNKKKKKRIKKE